MSSAAYYTKFFTAPELLPPVTEEETFWQYFEPRTLLVELFAFVTCSLIPYLVARKCLADIAQRITLDTLLSTVEALEDQFPETVESPVVETQSPSLIPLCHSLIIFLD